MFNVVASVERYWLEFDRKYTAANQHRRLRVWKLKRRSVTRRKLNRRISTALCSITGRTNSKNARTFIPVWAVSAARPLYSHDRDCRLRRIFKGGTLTEVTGKTGWFSFQHFCLFFSLTKPLPSASSHPSSHLSACNRRFSLIRFVFRCSSISL